MDMQPQMEQPRRHEPLHAKLSLSRRNEMQRRLVEEFHMDPMAWITKYAGLFDEITTHSKKLRALVERDPEAAAEIIRRRLEAEVGV